MANSNVYTGFWIDHSKGHVLGATITLDSKWGGQLVAAAAILVQIIGTALWSIMAFVLHQYFSTPHLRDEFDAQLQVILRNSAGPDSTAWHLLVLGRTWRGRKAKALRQGALLALLPAVVWIGFLAAGVFVGQIASNSFDAPIVLKRAGNCGAIQTDMRSNQSIFGYEHAQVNVSNSARQYAQSCYSEAASGGISCSVYSKKYLEYDHFEDQPCPIPGACFDEAGDMAMTLRTKPLDSHDDLGINAPKADRLTLEYQTTCAPLRYDFVDANTEVLSGNVSGHVNTTLQIYNFGVLKTGPSAGNGLFQYCPIIRDFGASPSSGILGYSLNAFRALSPWNGSNNDWTPRPPFRQFQGDLILLFLTPNGLTYTRPVQDPMFRTATDADPNYPNYPYVPVRDVYAMACTDLYQICNPANSKCTGWLGATGADVLMPSGSTITMDLKLNEAQTRPSPVSPPWSSKSLRIEAWSALLIHLWHLPTWTPLEARSLSQTGFGNER